MQPKLLRRGLAVAGLLGAGVAAVAAEATVRLPAAFLLELDLEEHRLCERPPPGLGLHSILPGARSQLALSQVVEVVRAAGSDVRVGGLLGLLSSQAEGGMGLAQVQEVRDAVTEFRRVSRPVLATEGADNHAPPARAAWRLRPHPGRPRPRWHSYLIVPTHALNLACRRRSALRGAATVAYTDAFGEAGGGTATYYLATAFDFIFMQPTGMLSATGLSATTTFARGLLDRWRVRPIFFAREVTVPAHPPARPPARPPAHPPACPLLPHLCTLECGITTVVMLSRIVRSSTLQEYKLAASFVNNSAAPAAERQAVASTLRSLSGQVVRGIAAGRRMTESQVRGHGALVSVRLSVCSPMPCAYGMLLTLCPPAIASLKFLCLAPALRRLMLAGACGH